MGDLAVHLPDASHRKLPPHGEQGVPLSTWIRQEVLEVVDALAVVLDEECLVLLQWRIHKEAQGAAGLQDRAVSAVLGKERALALALGAEPDTRAGLVGIDRDVHAPILAGRRARAQPEMTLGPA